VESYEEIWEKFRKERRLQFGGYMDPAWRDGHQLSASFMVPVDASPFRERFAPLREALDTFPFVSLHPEHFMHITLLIAGFPTRDPAHEKEISFERLNEVAEHTRKSLEGFPPFSLRLANLNAFPGAAFIEVHDAGNLEKLRTEICESCGMKRPPGPPHLTLAYFQAPDGTSTPETLIRTIERYRDWPVGEIEVESVELTLLKLDEVYPEPQRLAEFRLGGTAPAQDLSG
jgi:2'-5' RNA ligase